MGKRKTDHRAEEEVDIALRGKPPPKVVAPVAPAAPVAPKPVVVTKPPVALAPQCSIVPETSEPKKIKEELEEEQVIDTKEFIQRIKIKVEPVEQVEKPIKKRVVVQRRNQWFEDEMKRVAPRVETPIQGPIEVMFQHGKVKNLEWRVDCVQITFENQEFQRYNWLSLMQIMHSIRNIHTLRFVEHSFPEVVQNLLDGKEDKFGLRKKLMECKVKWIDISLFKNYKKANQLLELFPKSTKIEVNSVVLPIIDVAFRKMMNRTNAMNCCLSEPVDFTMITGFLKDPYFEVINVPVKGDFDPQQFINEWKAGKRIITRWNFRYSEKVLPNDKKRVVEYRRAKDTKILSVTTCRERISLDTALDSKLFE